MTGIAREAMEYDVVIVGAGPAGLSAAIRLKQLDPDLAVVVLEKGSEVGAHILSGAVLDPCGLDALLPDWRTMDAPIKTEVKHDNFYVLGEAGQVRIPNWPMPPLMNNHGKYIVSMGNVCRWMATVAEGLGVEIFPGMAASELVYGDKGEVKGVVAGEFGKNPDGSGYTARRRKVYRTQQGIKFVWNNEVRTLKNWRGGLGKYGQMITGFDEKRRGIRTFYRADIERYLEIKTQSTTQAETKKAPMFTRLRTLRFMKVRPDAGGVSVGFDGIAARIARIHQYGLQDEVGPGAYAQYPARELLGMTPADLIATENAVISSLGGAS